MTNSHLHGITRSFLLFNVELQLLQIIVINSCSLSHSFSLFLSFPPIFHLFSVNILSPSRYYISFFFLILQSSSRYTSNQNSRTYIYVYTFNWYNNRKVTYANTSAKEDHDWNLRYISIFVSNMPKICVSLPKIYLLLHFVHAFTSRNIFYVITTWNLIIQRELDNNGNVRHNAEEIYKSRCSLSFDRQQRTESSRTIVQISMKKRTINLLSEVPYTLNYENLTLTQNLLLMIVLLGYTE